MAGDEQPFDNVAGLLQKLRRDGVEAIVITGGEPATYRDLAAGLNRILADGFEKVVIHTNGAVVDRLDVLSLASNQPSRLQFVISLHGHTPDTHDNVVSCRGSFRRVMSLAEWSAAHGVSFAVNSAILRENVAHLHDLVALTRTIGARSATLSLVHDCSLDLRFKAPMLDAISAVRRVAESAGRVFTTDGIPYCLLRGYEEVVGESHWPKPLLVISLRGQMFNYKNDLLHDLRCRPEECSECIMESVCMGVYREYRSDLQRIYTGPIKRPKQSAPVVREACGGPCAGEP